VRIANGGFTIHDPRFTKWKLAMPKLQTPIRRNDQVVVTTGKDSGKKGRVLKVLPTKNRVIVEGVNMIKRHTRPNPQRNIKGGIVEREGALHASNVQLVCPECGKMTRIGHRIDGDRKVRICRKCEGVVDK
jgi:large subunit ribosomal protein L24